MGYESWTIRLRTTLDAAWVIGTALADRALLDALAADGRTGVPALAAATGWSGSTVRRRLEHLRRSAALLIQLEFGPRALGRKPDCGTTNLMAEVICRDAGDLYRYLTEKVSSLLAMQTVETAPVMRTLKRIGTTQPFGAR